GGHREGVLDIALVEDHAPQQLLDRAGIAAPALEGVHLDLGQSQQVVGEKAADWPGDAGDQNTDGHARVSFSVVEAFSRSSGIFVLVGSILECRKVGMYEIFASIRANCEWRSH